MGLSLFLAKLFGVYFLIAALLAFVRKEQIQTGVRSWMGSQGLMLFSGLFNIVVGLAILIGHPVWEMSWRVAITLIGVLALVQGVLRAGFPDEVRKWFGRFQAEKVYWVSIAFLVILGVFFIYHGFRI